MSIYVGTGRINYPAMRGPCPYGYHVGTHTEWSAINLAGINLGAWRGNNGIGLMTYLKLPMAGIRSNSNGAVLYQGADGYYTCCDVNSSNAPYQLFFHNTSVAVTYGAKRGGQSIRPIKDEPVKPTSSWTTLYDGSSVASGAGIFWNSSSGLISISADGTTWYTITDKNLGATTVYNYGDAFSASNCGCFFQRGNNYPFPGSGNVSTSTTAIDASAYGPGNWYYNSTWRYPSGSDRSSVTNNNLRGGVVGAVKADVKDICVGAGVDDYSSMQGPCPDGFHIPSSNEWVNVKNAGVTLGAWTSSGDSINNFITKLHIPQGGARLDGGGYDSSNTCYWACNAHIISGNYRIYGQAFMLYSSAFNVQGCVTHRSHFIRPFKNDPVAPDSTRTTIQSGTGGAGIFWSKGLGLISISADGTTWYTMADKNLGANVVYNYGDTISDNNCGGLFQWGNNYMFPRTGTISDTTSTGVDAGGFGPGNYYFNKTQNKASPRDTTRNTNLRGYITGIQKKGNVKQAYVGTTIARPTYKPGIYWNKNKGLISISSDGKKWYTIADKNAGAKVVYNDGDTLSQDNCGYYYQWGNNYGFAWTGSVSNTTTKVNASTYGPTNPYYGSTFIKVSSSPYDRSSVQNDNLWGNTTNTLVARQGPCPTGRHIPFYTELNNIKSAGVTLGAWTASGGNNFKKYLKIPYAGRRVYNTGNVGDQGSSGYYYTSQTTSGYGLGFTLSASSINLNRSPYRSYGLSIRALKNEPVVPDNSRAVLYQPS